MNMGDWFLKLLETAPPLAVLVILAYLFIRHLERRDDMLKQFNREHLDERVMTREALRENTSSNKEAARSSLELKDAVKDLELELKKITKN